MADVKTILENLGYKLTNDGGKYYRAKPLYRQSDNRNSLRISKKTGWFVDYGGDGLRGSMVDLVSMTLNLKNFEDAKSWLSGHQYNLEHFRDDTAKIEVSNSFYPENMLDKLVKDHTYWNNRGVEDSVLANYEGGVATTGAMENRYTFPIRNRNKKIIGFVGRDITNKKSAKWKICGPKSEFCYPELHIGNCRNRREIIIVESIGDCLSLAQAGITNTLVLFGISLPDKLISLMAGLSPKKILISLNNDIDNGDVGQKACAKIKATLERFFDEGVCVVALPTKKDFGDMSVNEIREWGIQYGIN